MTIAAICMIQVAGLAAAISPCEIHLSEQGRIAHVDFNESFVDVLPSCQQVSVEVRRSVDSLGAETTLIRVKSPDHHCQINIKHETMTSWLLLRQESYWGDVEVRPFKGRGGRVTFR